MLRCAYVSILADVDKTLLVTAHCENYEKVLAFSIVLIGDGSQRRRNASARTRCHDQPTHPAQLTRATRCALSLEGESMKKFIQFSLAAALLFTVAPLAASAQQMTATDQTDVTQAEIVAQLQDPQWAAMHADEARTSPSDFARDWRLHDSLRIVRLEEGGS
jgi:hypothetical protein